MQPEAFADAVVVLVKNALSPVLERLAVAEAGLAALRDVPDRVLIIETKAALAPTVVPIVDPQPVDLAPVLEKIEAVKTDANALRERVAVAEMRQLIQGPAGHDGRDGIPGRDGKDGLDGLGWDDLSVEQVNERTFSVKCLRGLQVKELGTLTFPVEIYRGVYRDGQPYERGDCVTFGGSEFHCNEATTTKPEQSKAWTLKVKRGRDGKDGKDASVPVVTVHR